MERKRILGITAEKTIRNEIVIVTVNTPRIHIVPERALTEKNIKLGHLVSFEIIDNTPCRFTSILPSEFFEDGVSLIGKEWFTVVDNIRGTLRETENGRKYYFEVPEIGKCAYIGIESLLMNDRGVPTIGRASRLVLRLLADDEKIGEFSKNYTWAAEIRQDEHSQETIQRSSVRSQDRTTYTMERTRLRSSFRRSGKSVERKNILWRDEVGEPLEQKNEKAIPIEKTEKLGGGVTYSTIPNRNVDELMGNLESLNLYHLQDGVNIQEKVPAVKRAIICYIEDNRRNPEGLTYFLWLIDDHKPSVYHTKTKTSHLKLGYAFEGGFVEAKQGSIFECKIDLNSIELDGIEILVCGSDIEVSLRAAEHYQDPNCLYHHYFGVIKNPKKVDLSRYFNSKNEICVAIIRSKKDSYRGWMINRPLPQTALR